MRRKHRGYISSRYLGQVSYMTKVNVDILIPWHYKSVQPRKGNAGDIA